MSDLTNNFIAEFQDKETRHIYANDFLNTWIATQIKVLREDHEWTQAQLAEETGMKQERISVLEDVNYESWTIKTLKRFAWAFDLRLSIKFENFGSFLTDYDNFEREKLKRLSFDKDPAFHPELAAKAVFVRGQPGTGKTYQVLRALNTASATTIRNFKGNPAQTRFRFMDQLQPVISDVVSTPTPDVTLEDFKEANYELATMGFVRKRVA